MPGKVKVKIISGRNLPVMDRSSDTTDAYVEIKLGGTTYKTDVCRKSLHPQWNSEWYRFEVDDSELQDEPLQIRLMDHDTYSANDAIGKVYLDLNPLLLPTARGEVSAEHPANSVMSGWIPVYDTMHGIRGEVNVVVKVELFSDFNRFRQSSCGIQFFCSKSIPQGYFAQTVQGFVEELIVNDDPEYQWIDKIRTPRASNEARQTLFFKLSGELQRKIGVKALDLGGNAVIGYCQCFDLEGECGIVARGIGTAITLVKLSDATATTTITTITTNSGPEVVNEERAQDYLRFLGAASGFRLSPLPTSPNKEPPSLKIPAIDLEHPRYKPVVKCLYNTNLEQQLRHTQSNPTLNQQRIKHPSVKTLLKQEDMRGTPGYGLGQKIKNFKYTSQNILSKKMIALKAKLGDSGIGEELEREDSNKIYKRNISESSVMAELLARSVIHAHNSLSCIMETQDQSQSDDGNEEPDTDHLELEKSLLGKNVSVSEPFLSVENQNLDSHSSNVSSSSSESSSSDDDYAPESSIDFETVSNIVKNVEILEKEYSDRARRSFSKQYSLPAEINLGSIENLNAPSTEQELTDNEINYLKERDLEQAPLATIESDDSYSEDSPVPTSNINKPKTIIPAAKVGGDVTHQSLMKTAMQTMLLDKLNIIGTYTPPVSPTSVSSNNFKVGSTASSSSSIPTPSTPRFLIPKKGFPRSATAISLIDYDRHDSVLGVPFTSMCDISRQQSQPCLTSMSDSQSFIGDGRSNNCLSDTELHKNRIDKTDKAKFSFVNLLGKTHELGQTKLKRGVSHDQLEKRKFSFLHLAGNRRRRSQGPETTLKKVKSDELHKGRFSFLNRHKRPPSDASNTESNKSHFSLSNIFHKSEKKVDNNNEDGMLKKHGLLGAALGNVVMETVQDILATSHTKKDDDNKSCPSFPSSSILTANSTATNINNNNNSNNNNNVVTNNHETSLSVSKSPVPFNTEIDKSTACGDNMHASLTPSHRNQDNNDIQHLEYGHQRTESIGARIQSPAKLNQVPGIHRRSSDSDLSITPKGNSLTGNDRSGPGTTNGLTFKTALQRTTVPQENFDMLEYPFLTMSKYPPGFVFQLGGAVSARSVKLLERISNLEEPETRDTWWSEIRMEIRSHARALNCNAVLGYSETTSICEDVCVLSASGTAAVIGFQYGETNQKQYLKEAITLTGETDKDKVAQKEKPGKLPPDSPEPDIFPTAATAATPPINSCSLCHLPYNTNNVPIRATVLKCGLCRIGKVPDILIATIEVPENISIMGRGCFIQSFVCRQLKDAKGESNAKEISDGLPFLEYELHRLLINKLKIKGMNSIFGLKIRISIGEKMLVGIATGTGLFLNALPAPLLPKLIADRAADEKKINDLQKLLVDTVRRNREIYQLKNIDDCPNGRMASDDDSEDETSMDLAMGNKDCCVLEVDDPEDAEVVNLLMEERPPDGFHVVSTEYVPGMDELEIVKNLQMFKQIYRAKFQPPYNFEVHLHRLLQSVYFKLRRMVPCALCDLKFRVDLPDIDEIQLCVLGMALGLGDPQKMKFKRRNTMTKRNDDDLIFNLEEDQIPENSVPVVVAPPLQNQNYLTTYTARHRQKSPSRNRIQTIKQRHIPYRERHGVDITPLSYVPGGRIEHYLGNLNFFFIRETTSIREEGGLSGFIHSFVTEILAIVRAHVTALGGNAMVAYFMTECVLNHNLHKNQGQCLINVGGDVVFVSYFNEDP